MKSIESEIKVILFHKLRTKHYQTRQTMSYKYNEIKKWMWTNLVSVCITTSVPNVNKIKLIQMLIWSGASTVHAAFIYCYSTTLSKFQTRLSGIIHRHNLQLRNEYFEQSRPVPFFIGLFYSRQVKLGGFKLHFD